MRLVRNNPKPRLLILKTPKNPKNKTFGEFYYELAPLCQCATIIAGSQTSPDWLHIRLRGPIAQVPSLKNQKIKNSNILRPKAKALLSLMTKAFFKSVGYNLPSFTGEVFCLVVCAYRTVTFDEDNVLTTVKDWLEPQVIRQKDRGWGVGIVKNDRNVNAYAIKKSKLTPDSDVTEIYIRKVSDILEARNNFIKSIIEP